MNNELHSFCRCYNRKSQGTKNQLAIGTNHSPDAKEAKLGFHWIRYREALYWGKCKKYLVKKGDLTAFGKQDSLIFWARNERLFWRVCREFGKLYSGVFRERRLQINSQIIITDKRTEDENISTECQDTALNHLSISYRCQDKNEPIKNYCFHTFKINLIDNQQYDFQATLKDKVHG